MKENDQNAHAQTTWNEAQLNQIRSMEMTRI